MKIVFKSGKVLFIRMSDVLQITEVHEKEEYELCIVYNDNEERRIRLTKEEYEEFVEEFNALR